MQRFKFPLLSVLLTLGLMNSAVLACGGSGGYRGPYRPSYRPAVRYAAPLVVQRPVIVQQPVIHQPAFQQPAIRPVSVAAVGSPIRLAPTQVAQPVSAAPARQPAEAAQQGGGIAATAAPAPATPPATQQLNGPVGTWTAQANGQAKVTLQLNADNTFEWIAENNGRTSRFRGNFQLAANKLTLARSSDNQKLVGAITFTNAGFEFKLDGAKDAGLQFVPQSS